MKRYKVYTQEVSIIERENYIDASSFAEAARLVLKGKAFDSKVIKKNNPGVNVLSVMECNVPELKLPD